MNEKCGCPLCTVEHKLKTDELERILGAAMMEPDIRVKTNDQGFCGDHLEAMLSMSNKLSLALMLQTHLDTFSKKLYKDTVPLLKKSPEPKKQLSVLAKKQNSCYLCTRINEFMNSTYAAFAYMYKLDREFEQKIREQPYFCVRHLQKLLEAGTGELSKEEYRAFATAISEVCAEYAKTLSEDLAWFCKKFDYRYKDEDWKNSKDAVQRTVKYLK